MPSLTTTAEAVAKMHVSHVTQAEAVGQAEQIDALYDMIEDLPTVELVFLAAALAAYNRQVVSEPLSEAEPSNVAMFAALFQSGTLISLLGFVNVVLISRVAESTDDVDNPKNVRNLAQAIESCENLAKAVVDRQVAQFSDKNLSEAVGKVEARFNELVAQGVAEDKAAHQATVEVLGLNPNQVDVKTVKDEDVVIEPKIGMYL